MDMENGLRILDMLDKERRENNKRPKEQQRYTDYEYRSACADIAKMIGLPSRNAWTDELKKDTYSMYAMELAEMGFTFDC